MRVGIDYIVVQMLDGRHIIQSRKLLHLGAVFTSNVFSGGVQKILEIHRLLCFMHCGHRFEYWSFSDFRELVAVHMVFLFLLIFGAHLDLESFIHVKTLFLVFDARKYFSWQG